MKEGEPIEINGGIAPSVMRSLQALLKKSGKSREELTDYLRDKLQRQIRVTTVDMWFSEGKSDKWPSFPILLLMCRFVGSYEPLEIMAEALGAKLIEQKDMRLVEVGRAYVGLSERVKDALVEAMVSKGEINF